MKKDDRVTLLGGGSKERQLLVLLGCILFYVVTSKK